MRFFTQLNFVREEIESSTEYKDHPARLSSLGKTVKVMTKAFTFAFREKEIFVFALMQWAVLALTYFLWVQMLDWIPEYVWQSTEYSDSGSIADVVFLVWSFVCVGLAAYPIGILSGCMGSAHLLHRLNGKSTIAKCLQLTLPQSWPLWTFHWIDGWYTVLQILERLPKREIRLPQFVLASEALYYAWKIGIAGMLPGLVTGRGLVASGRDSVKFVIANFGSVATLRLGYSTLCWVVGILSYIGAVLFIFGGGFVDSSKEVHSQVYEIYLWVGLPLMVGVGVVMLFLRPFYILAMCELYYLHINSSDASVTLDNRENRYLDAFVAFAVLLLFTAVAFVYRHELGIVDMLSVPYGQSW